MIDVDRSTLARERAAKAVNQGQDANLHAAPSRSVASEQAPRTAPSPGTARREGRGFVDSYGRGRTCSVDGCATRLSQYNGRTVCGVHDAPSRA